jgi:hypothetical protein
MALVVFPSFGRRKSSFLLHGVHNARRCRVRTQRWVDPVIPYPQLFIDSTASRTRTMYFPSSLVALASLFAPPVGAWLMKKNIIFPFLLAISLELAFYPLILAFPETLNHTSCSQSSRTTAEDSMIIAQDHQQKQTWPVNELPQTLVPSRKSLKIQL